MNNIINPNYGFVSAGLFETDGEWIHPERIEKSFEIIYVRRGRVKMAEGERQIDARAGELFILSPNICHKGTAHTSDVSFYWVHFKTTDGTLPFSARYFENFENSYLFKELLHSCRLPKPPEPLISGVLMHILGELCRLSEEDAERYDSTVEKIYEWIRINAYADLTVSAVAEHFGYSPDHISRICKSNYKMSAGELIDHFLILRAKEQLSHTGKYVKEIAADLRFRDDKAFIGYFKYHEKTSPTGFRNRYSRLYMNNK